MDLNSLIAINHSKCHVLLRRLYKLYEKTKMYVYYYALDINIVIQIIN